MNVFRFGGPDGGILQVAFVVKNIHSAIKEFTNIFRAGPWLYTERVHIQDALYRGIPTNFLGSTAVANAGLIQIEMIQQLDDAPSVYTEIVKKNGYGFHHLGIVVRNFDVKLDEYKKLGNEVAFYLDTGLNRIAYIDMKGEFPYFMKVTEVTDRMEEIFYILSQASAGWDGKEPIRDLSWLSSLLSKPNSD